MRCCGFCWILPGACCSAHHKVIKGFIDVASVERPWSQSQQTTDFLLYCGSGSKAGRTGSLRKSVASL